MGNFVVVDYEPHAGLTFRGKHSEAGKARVRAKIPNIEAFSSHADQAGLLKWLSNFKTAPRVFLTHGEDPPREVLARLVSQQLSLKVEMPAKGQEIQV